MKNILALHGKYTASNFYRLISPLESIGGETRDKVIPGARKNGRLDFEKVVEEFSKHRAVIVKYVTDPKQIEVLLSARDKSFTPLFVDVDDFVFGIPDGNSAARHWDYEKVNNFQYLLQECDGIICSTETLALQMRAYNRTVTLANKINPDMWKARKPKKEDGIIRIGWTFSKTHIPDIDAVRDAIIAVKEKYGDKVEFQMTEGVIKKNGTEYAKGIMPVKFRDFPKFLRTSGWDIGIAPLRKNLFNECKSNIKWLEYSMAGIPTVASRVYPYEYSIEEGRTGLLAGSTNQWINALSTLIEDAGLRKTMADNAREAVLRDYNITNDTTWGQLNHV